ALMTNSVSSLIRGMGHASLEFKIQTFKSIFLYVPLVYLGIYFYGIEGAAIAILINKVFFVVISQFFLRRLINITYRELFTALKEILLASFLAFSAAYILYELYHVHYVITASVLAAVYLAVVYS